MPERIAMVVIVDCPPAVEDQAYANEYTRRLLENAMLSHPILGRLTPVVMPFDE